MRVKTLLFVAVAVVLALTPVMGVAQDAETCDLVSLFDGWARATVEGAPNSAAYGVLVNLGAEDDTLIAASTEAAEAVELHEMKMGDGDVMMMRPVEGGFAAPANGFTVLEPGGLHIMLINLTAPLVAGEELAITLTFRTCWRSRVEPADPRDAGRRRDGDGQRADGHGSRRHGDAQRRESMA
ncbi:MAG: copper chaperone PCu(A)C [Chloroflexi bacterium]|nr:copper chaperone PCu(A)C [Chloroflexota bacterium]